MWIDNILMRYIITHAVYNKYLGVTVRENFNYLAHVYGVKAYARLSRVFYDAGDKKISTLVTTRDKI